MAVLVDASVALRLRHPQSPHHAQCLAVLDPDVAARHDLRLCAQTLIEYWVVATRPVAQNGFGLTTELATRDLTRLRSFLPTLPEPPDVAERWLRLVSTYDVKGKPSHDARMAAVMEAHGVAQLLTLNARDFSRYTMLACVTPAQLLQATT
jgi:predicted nucleic acid-binding protein